MSPIGSGSLPKQTISDASHLHRILIKSPPSSQLLLCPPPPRIDKIADPKRASNKKTQTILGTRWNTQFCRIQTISGNFFYKRINSGNMIKHIILQIIKNFTTKKNSYGFMDNKLENFFVNICMTTVFFRSYA